MTSISNLELRPLRTTDFKIYNQLVSNPIIAKAARFKPAKNERDAHRLFQDDLRNSKSYAVTLNRRMIGMIALYSTVGQHGGPNHTVLELADMTLPKFQDHGYMSRAVNLLINKLRQNWNSQVKRLVALVSKNNLASRKVLAKNHFHTYNSVMDMNTGGEDLVYQFDL